MITKTSPRSHIHDILRQVIAARGISIYRLANISGFTYSHTFRIVKKGYSVKGAIHCLQSLGFVVREVVEIEEGGAL